jgi:hypothetical protein
LPPLHQNPSPDFVSDQQIQDFKLSITAQGFLIGQALGFGNCLFHTFLSCMQANTIFPSVPGLDHVRLREQLCQFLIDISNESPQYNTSLLQHAQANGFKSIHDYISFVRKPGIDADALLIQAFAEKHHVQVCVHSSRDKQPTRFVPALLPHPDSLPILNIAHVPFKGVPFKGNTLNHFIQRFSKAALPPSSTPPPTSATQSDPLNFLIGELNFKTYKCLQLC